MQIDSAYPFLRLIGYVVLFVFVFLSWQEAVFWCLFLFFKQL